MTPPRAESAYLPPSPRAGGASSMSASACAAAPSRPHRPSARRSGRAPSGVARSSAGAQSPERRPVRGGKRVSEEVVRISIHQATQHICSRKTGRP
eukprot:scaffold8836_cov62-Phaeocystis_antarctica.AAC.7